jgi:hypothetical protein
MDNFDLRKYLAEGKLLKESTSNNYSYNPEPEDPEFFMLDPKKAEEYLSQFNNDEIDAESFLDDDESSEDLFIDGIEEMSNEEVEEILRQAMSFYYFSDGDSI